jgi:polysaccharide pyruvyl transferase WcaK-like protein
MDKLKNTVLNLLGKYGRLLGAYSPRKWDEVTTTGWRWAWPNVQPETPGRGGLRVLIVGGYGYQNVGDEAQLGANLERWRQRVPGCEITVLSPHPAYTSKTHEVRSEFASRVVWFDANRRNDYAQSNRRFQKEYWKVRRRMVASAHCLRAGIPLLFCLPDETRLLALIQQADVLHLSGGGYMTGMTRSRLWDHCLLIELCHLLGTPVIMTGQTIGVFRSRADRRLAKQALKPVRAITLRDHGRSEADVRALGVRASRVQSTHDDALFCGTAPAEAVAAAVRQAGLDPDMPFIAANFHYWGLSSEQKEAAAVRFAQLSDHLGTVSNAPVLFVPMVPGDEQPERDVMARMHCRTAMLEYAYDYRLARGVLGAASLVFTMKHHPIIFAYGEGVSVAAVALDPYYFQKNRGAMELFGQEAYCLDAEAFFSEKALALLTGLWNSRGAEALAIALEVENMRSRDGQTLDSFLRSQAEDQVRINENKMS